MRKLLIVILVLVVLGVIGVAGGVWYVKRAQPDYGGAVQNAALRQDVEVWRDSAGVPRVWAHNVDVMLFAQGYLHAEERLWQLELFRRVGEGRLSEVLGDSMVDTDKFVRTVV